MFHITFNNTEAKLIRKHLREHDQKAALSSEVREKRNKPGISKNSATCRIRICDILQSRDFESHALSTQPRKLNNRQILVTHKTATYSLKKMPRNSAKVAPNSNRLNFASNNLEYNKLKASTSTLHVTNGKA